MRPSCPLGDSTRAPASFEGTHTRPASSAHTLLMLPTRSRAFQKGLCRGHAPALHPRCFGWFAPRPLLSSLALLFAQALSPSLGPVPLWEHSQDSPPG